MRVLRAYSCVFEGDVCMSNMRYIHVCVCVCIYIYIYICMSYMRCIHAFIYIYIYIYIYVCMYVYVCILMRGLFAEPDGFPHLMCFFFRI